MKKKLKLSNRSVLIILSMLLYGISSCTKKDDATIDDATLNIVLSYSGTIGTNIDTSFTALGNSFSTLLQTNADVKMVNFDGFGGTTFMNDKDIIVNSISRGFLTVITPGTLIDTSTSAWLTGMTENTGGFLYVKDIVDSRGINGTGDQYIAIRTGSAPSYKYGWIRVNLSTDANTLTIREIAMSNVANRPIEAGDK